MGKLELIGRTEGLFTKDILDYEKILGREISSAKILVIGAAGSIGQAVTIELFKRSPKVLHAVDISENNLVELVRSIRSTIGYSSGEFKTFAVDCGSPIFKSLVKTYGPYDYVFNLSALKHVRSEKDPYTLMRLIQTNIFNTVSTLRHTSTQRLENYFCVSTDKAANPVNMMGASKRIMEHFLMRESYSQKISMARFANVAFSDGSLLHGFNQRFLKQQPLSAPNDIQRYFITPQEAGELCVLAGLCGSNRDIFFPKLEKELHLEKFSTIAERFIASMGYEPYYCNTEEEARLKINELTAIKKWPVYFFTSDTTGEKASEEFYTSSDQINFDQYSKVGIIQNDINFDTQKLDFFEKQVKEMLSNGVWDTRELVELFAFILPDFSHKNTGKYLDDRM